MKQSRIEPGRNAAQQIVTLSAARLRETSRLLGIAEGLANFGHWRSDPFDPLLDLSAQASEIAGVLRHGLLTWRQAVRMVHARDRGNLLRCIVGARTGALGISCRIRLNRPDGQRRHIIVQVQADESPEGGAAGLMGVIRDITDLVAAEDRLIAARDDAEAATRAKSEFLATMSHEIRTPMTGVMGMIHLLRSNPTDEERERYLGAMQQSAELLMAVLDGILDFSKVESGLMELDPRDFDIEELAHRTHDMFQNAAAEKGLTFDLSVAAGASPLVFGDPVRIQQVMSNFISNAIKFTERGHIQMAIRAQPRSGKRQRWRVQIKDTGIGLAQSELDQLFQPFVQMGNRRVGGTGLGLAISRRLVDAMSGKTGVRSVPGRGSTFWFEVELPIGVIGSDATIEGPSAALAVRPLNVLIAEDNPVNQLLIAALVRRLGHGAICVENGRVAVEVAAATPFDCILMDMQMPEMDGIAATRAIRTGAGLNASVPIIALTADAAPERRRFYDNVGLTEFLTKPVSVDALRRHLSQIAALPASPATQPAGEQPIDAERVAELRLVLGAAKTGELIAVFEAELATRPAAIRQCAALDDLPAMRAEAHSLVGAVGYFGASGVERAAKALETVSLGAECEIALARLDREVGSARDALARLTAGDSNAGDRRSA